MGNKLIRYEDLGDKFQKYTDFVVWSGSKEQKINHWLNPIYAFAKKESKFYEISNERGCGWYIEKDTVLKMLQNNIPKIDNSEWQNEFASILKNLNDYIINYKEPQQ